MKMKILGLFFLAFFVLNAKAATHTDSDGHTGWFVVGDPPGFVYGTPWISDMKSRITNNSALTDAQKADGLAAIDWVRNYTINKLVVNSDDFDCAQLVGVATATTRVVRDPDAYAIPPAPNAIIGQYYSVVFDIQIAEPAAVNQAPTVSWTSAPSSTQSGKNYTITAHGHDADGNLTQINVWKNGQLFAFASGGDGTDTDAGDTTSDAGPVTVTFTAQTTDAAGATSAIISQKVEIKGPVLKPWVTITTPLEFRRSSQPTLRMELN